MIDLAAPWDQQPWAVVDFETTGLDDDCMPVSVAAVRFEVCREVDSFYSLINPGMPIPAEASAIHGITDAMVADAPTFADVAPAISARAVDAAPVAYNAAYDRPIFHRVKTGASGAPLWDESQAWIDPLVMVRDADRYVRGSGKNKLENVCKRRSVELDGAHNALADARATGRLLVQLLASGAVKSCPLGKLLAHIASRRDEQDREFQAWRAKQQAREAV